MRTTSATRSTVHTWRRPLTRIPSTSSSTPFTPPTIVSLGSVANVKCVCAKKAAYYLLQRTNIGLTTSGALRLHHIHMVGIVQQGVGRGKSRGKHFPRVMLTTTGEAIIPRFSSTLRY